MPKTKLLDGAEWDIGSIGNATWGGAKLADVLELVGIPKCSQETSAGGKHVEFVSKDQIEEENGGPYRASVPLSYTTDPDNDILLAYEMNEKTLTRDHGNPLRMLIPGCIGARAVKWLDTINILAEENQGHFMQKDYKVFPPYVTSSDKADYSSRRPIFPYPVQSAIAYPSDSEVVKPGKISIKGYAIYGGGHGIERVDVSADGGKTWAEASRSQKDGVPYTADAQDRDKWAWVLFELETDIQKNTEIVVRAVRCELQSLFSNGNSFPYIHLVTEMFWCTGIPG